MAHIHSVYDTDTHFIIDENTRAIQSQADTAPVLVQHDHNSERFTFELPRHIDGHDMTLCNEVEIHYLNIEASTRTTEAGVYNVDDLAALDGGEEKVVCSWLISGNATLYAGKLNFMLSFKCVDENGKVTYRWNTDIYTDTTVRSGIDNGEAVVQEYPDILAEWQARISAVEQIASSITVDDALSSDSENPVQNKVIAQKMSLVDEAVAKMAQDIADLKYEEIKITSISNNVGTVEMGTTVSSVTITWALNKEPVSQTVDGKGVAADARSHTLSGLSIKANKSYAVTATDERNATSTASTGITFLNGVYYGVVESGTTINNAAILALTRKLQSGKGITFTVDAGEGQKVMYALPSRYGTPGFNVGGFDGGFSKKATISFKNASGYSENYDVYVSDNAGLGNTTVKVS